MKIFPKREETAFIIYNENNEAITGTTIDSPDQEVRLNYEGLEFVSLPLGEILVTFDSIMKKFY